MFLKVLAFCSAICRLLSLSVEGKLHTLLRTLARAAAFHLRHEDSYRHIQKLKDNGWKTTIMPSCGTFTFASALDEEMDRLWTDREMHDSDRILKISSHHRART